MNDYDHLHFNLALYLQSVHLSLSNTPPVHLHLCWRIDSFHFVILHFPLLFKHPIIHHFNHTSSISIGCFITDYYQYY